MRRILFLKLLLVACTTHADSENARAQTRIQQQPRIVRESPAEWKAARVVALTAQARWCTSVDAVGCDFKSIDDVILLPSGGIVASSVPGPMRHFDANGQLIGNLGAKGKGPGEYGFIAQPQLVGERIVWYDNTQMRIASVSLKNVPGKVSPNMLPMTTGMIYMVAETLVVFDVPAANDTGTIVDATYRTVPLRGAPRILATVRTPSKFRPGSNMTRASAPFAPRVVSDVGADGTVAHSAGDVYAIDIFPAAGSRWRIESQSTARAVTTADRDSVVQSFVKAFRVPNEASLPPMVKEDLAAASKTFPPLHSIRVLRDGTVWVRLTPPPNDKRARWDVFGSDGKRIGQALLSPSAKVRDGNRDWVLVVELGADDVPTVVKYLVR